MIVALRRRYPVGLHGKAVRHAWPAVGDVAVPGGRPGILYRPGLQRQEHRRHYGHSRLLRLLRPGAPSTPLFAAFGNVLSGTAASLQPPNITTKRMPPRISVHFLGRKANRQRVYERWCSHPSRRGLGDTRSLHARSRTCCVTTHNLLHLQAGCGGAFSVVPFVSRRSLGLVCGAVGAGGNLGSAILQVCCFSSSCWP